MPAKRFRPPVRALCAIGTVAHNRQFTSHELSEYLREMPSAAAAVPKTMAWLRKHKLITKRGRGYSPTAKGWNMVEKACRRPAR